MIRIENLYKSFGKVKVLDGINLDLSPGKITVVLGPNGSGKTTLVKSILGLVVPDKGNIYVGEQHINGEWKYRDQISYLPQIARFPDNLTVKELISMIQDVRKDNAINNGLMDTYKLSPYLNKKLKNLSGGTRQKVNVVLFFMYNTPVLIMDEPTAGLDPTSLIKLKDRIIKEKESGKSVLLTTHIIPLVEEIADEIIFLLEGKIYYKGSWKELAKLKGELGLERTIAKILEEKQNA